MAEANEREKKNGMAKNQLVKVLLSDDPQSISNELLNALKGGASEVLLASTVAYAADLAYSTIPYT